MSLHQPFAPLAAGAVVFACGTSLMQSSRGMAYVQQYDLLTSSSEASFLDPAVLAPPACHEAVARNLTESSGGIFRRPEVPQESTKSGAAGSVQAPFYATFWAAQAFAMVFASLYA